MGSLLSRSVEIRISNRTQNSTLKNPRMCLERGSCSEAPRTRLLPGSSSSSQFPGGSPFWSIAGILVYEADSFTLAICFSNPTDYNRACMELGLELSLAKGHQDSLASTYTRMAYGTYSSSCQDIKFVRVIVDTSHGTAQLSHGPVKVTATMTYATASTLKVVLQEQPFEE